MPNAASPVEALPCLSSRSSRSLARPPLSTRRRAPRLQPVHAVPCPATPRHATRAIPVLSRRADLSSPVPTEPFQAPPAAPFDAQRRRALPFLPFRSRPILAGPVHSQRLHARPAFPFPATACLRCRATPAVRSPIQTTPFPSTLSSPALPFPAYRCVSPPRVASPAVRFAAQPYNSVPLDPCLSCPASLLRARPLNALPCESCRSQRRLARPILSLRCLSGLSKPSNPRLSKPVLSRPAVAVGASSRPAKPFLTCRSSPSHASPLLSRRFRAGPSQAIPASSSEGRARTLPSTLRCRFSAQGRPTANEMTYDHRSAFRLTRPRPQSVQ